MGCCGNGYVASGYSWDLSRSGVGNEPVDLSSFSKLIFVGPRIGSEEYRTSDGTGYLFGLNPFHREHTMPNGHVEELLGRFPHLFQVEELKVEELKVEKLKVEKLKVEEVQADQQVNVLMADTVPKKAVRVEEEQPFDFNQLKGIGPKMSGKLHEAGVVSAADFVGAELGLLKRVLRAGDAKVLEMIDEAKEYLTENVHVAA